jgi:predicted O-methyltransferase YrrM
MNWWDDFAWARWEPVSWWNNVTLKSLIERSRWTSTLEIGVGQYCNGIYLLGHSAKERGYRHVGIDVSATNLGRAKQVIEAYDLPVDLLSLDSKAVHWQRRMQLIYVDGGHSYEQVRGDIENFARWVARSGLMIFDDYGKRHLQVTEAVDDAIKEYKDRFEMIVLPAQQWAIWRRL